MWIKNSQTFQMSQHGGKFGRKEDDQTIDHFSWKHANQPSAQKHLFTSSRAYPDRSFDAEMSTAYQSPENSDLDSKAFGGT